MEVTVIFINGRPYYYDSKGKLVEIKKKTVKLAKAISNSEELWKTTVK
jgi:hypothetical protein